MCGQTFKFVLKPSVTLSGHNLAFHDVSVLSHNNMNTLKGYYSVRKGAIYYGMRMWKRLQSIWIEKVPTSQREEKENTKVATGAGP